MEACIYVGLGGAVGSVLRYLISLIELNGSPGVFPVKTLFINVAGSFLIGLIAALVGRDAEIDSNLILLLKVGLCGGFTTFSTFALESSNLMQGGKSGAAALYMLLSIVLSISAVISAQMMVR